MKQKQLIEKCVWMFCMKFENLMDCLNLHDFFVVHLYILFKKNNTTTKSLQSFGCCDYYSIGVFSTTEKYDIHHLLYIHQSDQFEEKTPHLRHVSRHCG